MFARYRLGYQVLLILALLEFAVAFSLGTAAIDRYVAPGGFVTTMLPAWIMLPLLWSGAVATEITRRRVDRPFAAVRRILYLHRHWLMRGALFVLMVLFLARAFTSYKTAIPRYVPFYADPMLAQLDRAILGTDAWRLTHAVLGPLETMLIDRVYALWVFVMLLYMGWFCFTRNQKLQLRGLLTYLFTWAVLGNFFALAFSSVGPCFYELFYGDPRYAPMMAQLRSISDQHPIIALGAMNFLIDSIGKERMGAGISAMPSLHVAIAFLCFLVTMTYARRWWPKVLAGAFFACIAIGSVHLGWHYAADGIVSLIGVGLIWWATGRFVDWVAAREEAAGAVAAPA